MMKRLFSVFMVLLVVTGWVSAQTFTNSRILNETAIGYKISADANYVKAVALAKQKGWALSMTNKDGNMAVLVGVTKQGLPQYRINHNNIIAAATTRANQLWPSGTSGLSLTGSSANMKNKMGIWDGGGVLGTHVELVGRINQKDNPSSIIDHATHVAGTMIASGVNKLAKGMAYGTQSIIAYDAFSADDIFQMSSEAAGLVVSNHSYGYIAGWYQNPSKNNRWEFWGLPKDTADYQFGYYSDYSQALDSVSYNAPFYLMVRSAGNPRSTNGPAVGQPYYRYDSLGNMVSAGNRPAGISNNDGYDIMESSGVAKNVLTVGAVSGLPLGYSKKEDVVMSSFSAWGPTDDGRIKPDIVADGVQVLSSISTSTTSYAAFDGTSMAAPNATGSLFLLQEYYSKLKSGAFLRSATLKGLAIHTADEAGTTPGPDYQFGWGLLNVEKAAAVITAAVPSNNSSTSPHLLYENTLAQGQSFTTTVVASGKGILKATICWTDVKGNVDTAASKLLNNRTKKLVNDLDIRITKGSGAGSKTYLPWTLDVANPAAPAVPGDNITDNVERIDIDSTVPGQTYTITVTHKGTLVKGSQAYSLLISGAGGAAYCTSASGGGGARIDSVSFKNIHSSNTAGSKTYTDNTALITDVEPVSTVPIAVKVSTADATSNPRIVKVFVDVNNNGVFESNELLATSGVLTSATQIYNGSVTLPALTVGNLYLMRVIVQETSLATDVLACGAYGKGETQDFRLKAISGANDIAISDIVSPVTNDCASGAQYLTVTISNNGTADQSNIPLSATIATTAGTLATLAYTYPGTLPAKSSINYTFQTPFVTAAGTTYTITVTANLATDQLLTNNTFAGSFTTAAKPAAITAIGAICGTNVNLKVTNADLSNYLWYTTATATQPFALGATTSTTTITTDKTYYVGKEVKTGIGPLNKTALSNAGGYRVSVDGFYVKINNSVPATIETARLYIGYPGQIKFTIADLIGTSSIKRLSSTIVDVYATTPTPAPGSVTGNNATDTGAIYYLGLPVPTTGDHILLTECVNSFGRTDSATIFRNNGITGTTTYPTGISNVISFTGNAQTGSESQFYYNLYDTKINTVGCPGDRTAVVATTSPVPVISQVADSLVSSVTNGNQWYLNDTAISGATTNHYKPKRVGIYKVIVTDALGCSQTSNTINVTVTATADVLANEIKLTVSPNPNNGIFNLAFEVSSKADLSIDILSSSGQKVFNNTYPDFTGKFSKQIQVDNLSSEFYILQIQHNKKTYVKKILIQK